MIIFTTKLFVDHCHLRELNQREKLSIYCSIFVPSLTCGHESRVITEKIRSQIETAEMGFLRRVAGVSLTDKVRNFVVHEELGVESLLLCVERRQLRWFGHPVRMHPGHLPVEEFQSRPAGRSSRGRPWSR